MPGDIMATKAIRGSIEGGAALKRHLEEIERRLGAGAHVRVGILESATYPAGKGKRAIPVAQVAFWNEFGTINAPERPFFRDMIEKKSPRWGVSLGNLLRRTGYDAEKAMALMGEGIAGQLRASITNWSDPPNSKRTVERKGFNKPLIETSLMLRSVDYQVMAGDGGGNEQ